MANWTKSTDNTTCIVNILNGDWDTGNHTPKPVIRAIEIPIGGGTQAVNLKRYEYILVHEISYNEKVKDIGYTGYEFEGRYQLDIRTGRTRAMLDSLFREARRVLWLNRINPLDTDSNAPEFAEIGAFIMRRDLSDKRVPCMRCVCDFYVRHRSKAVSTS